ncbi:DUF2946 family protein [uncultured Hyphomonas sp.]|uniref:DUF2946 family protein n=1 Tax=uncultured Hyphomonas sp. TaxID=225298 RepID=UPI002AAB2346|nr:DUF2946 family protein [uncultured Hyphomonas sp.]
MRHDLTSRLAIVALLFALLVRAAVPVGWMVGPDAETGVVSIQLCSGRTVAWSPQQGVDLDADAAGDHEDGKSPSDTDSATTSCPFALASHYLPAPDVDIAFDAPVFPQSAQTRPPVRAPPLRNIASAPLPARGPPVSV